MNDIRTTPQIDPSKSSRAERRAAAIIAQYIYELSDRHGRPAVAGDPRTANGFDPAPESEGR